MNNRLVIVLLLAVGGYFYLQNNSTSGPAGGDNMTATAAVSIAGGIMGESVNPGPDPTPGPKPPRKDCTYCNGTGKIRQGDGHMTDCPHCEPPNDPDPFTAKAKSCCPDCTCGDDCQCTYPGQCLVEANGGEPVDICDPVTGECRKYRDPNYSAQPAPPVVDTTTLDILREQCREMYKRKNYLGALTRINKMEYELLKMPKVQQLEPYRVDVMKARMNLDKRLTALDKEEYAQFLQDYKAYVEQNKKDFDYFKAQNMSTGEEVEFSSCGPEGCDVQIQTRNYGGPGANSFRKWGEGRPAYGQSFDDGFYGHGYSGGSCGAGGCN